MPNHMHGIIIIVANDDDSAGARQCRAPTITASNGETGSIVATIRRAPTNTEQFGKPVPGSIPTIIRAYKSAVTKHHRI
jgi:putative transposase